MTTTFKNIGMGISAGGTWAEINGKREWVAFLATAEGATRHTRLTAAKRTWHVSATVYADQPIRVTVTKIDCHRDEAATEALAGLAAYLGGPAAQANA